MVPFQIIDIFDDVDDTLYAFEQLYIEILNEHAPLKQTVIRGNQVSYMTEEWCKEIRYRNKLWKKFTRNRTNANYDQYKIQRNKCTSLRRKAIKEYFLKKSTEPENPREFWNVYRPFLHGKTKQANDIVLKDNEVVINEKGEIAKQFNEHFVKVADEIERISERDYGKNIEDHPSIEAIHQHKRDTNSPVCFEFHYTNEMQVKQLLSSVNVRKSCGFDMISQKFIKESTDAIVKPITNIP